MTATANLGDALLRHAVNPRHGIVPSVHVLPTTMADISGVWHASATRPGAEAQDSPAGGVGWTRDAAERAAIGEALERYAAAVTDLADPSNAVTGGGMLTLDDFSLFTAEQKQKRGFPHTDLYDGPVPSAAVYSLDGRAERWDVPALLVGLGDPRAGAAGHGLSTSSGLAAGTSLPIFEASASAAANSSTRSEPQGPTSTRSTASANSDAIPTSYTCSFHESTKLSNQSRLFYDLYLVNKLYIPPIASYPQERTSAASEAT